MSDDCKQGCPSHQAHEEDQQMEKAVKDSLNKVQNKILVMSGKGGVGKSTVAVNLAVSLALSGKRVGLLDIDIHGPSIPKMLQMEKQPLVAEQDSILPLIFSENLKVMSLGFAMQGQQEAVIWRGPMKHAVIRQFIGDVSWGDLDYLVVDSPPGTGDEPLSIAQLMANEAKAVIVTTPQEIALSDVRKSITFCRQLSIPVLGVIENMSGFVCPHCEKESEIFKSGGGEEMAAGMEVPFLGRIPLDPAMVIACDAGEPYMDQFKRTETSKAFEKIIQSLMQ